MGAFDDLIPGGTGVKGAFDDLIPAAQPKRQVGIAEAGGRGIGSTLAGQGNTLALAAAAPAMLVDAVGNLFRDKPSTAAQDFVFGNVVDPTRDAQKAYAINPATEQMDTGATIANVAGNLTGMAPSMIAGGAATVGPKLAALAPVIQNLVKGAVTAQPSFALPSTFSRAQDLLEAGVDGNTVAKASASNLAANTAMGALPLAKAGGLLTRAGTGAGLNVATGAGQRGAEAAILGDQYKAQQQDPFGGQEMGLDAGIGALMAAIMGPRSRMPARRQVDAAIQEKFANAPPPEAPPAPPDPVAANRAAVNAPPVIAVNSKGQAIPLAADGKPVDVGAVAGLMQNDIAAKTKLDKDASGAFALARGEPVNEPASVPDNQAAPETKGGMVERKQGAQDEAAITGEARDLRDASAGGTTTKEGTAATAPEEFTFIGVTRDNRGNITGTGPQVEVVERMTLQDANGKPIEAVRVRMDDGKEQVLPANQVESLSRPANPRFAQDVAEGTYAPRRGVGTGPDQPGPRRAAQRITTDESPEFIPGERNARTDNGPNDGRPDGERGPQTYDAEPSGRQETIAKPDEPARPDTAEPVKPDTAERDNGGARVADPRDVPRLQVDYEKMQTEARKTQTRLNTLLDTQAKSGLDEKRTASINDQVKRTRAKLDEQKAALKDIREQLTDERIPRKAAEADSIVSDLRREGGLSDALASDLGIGAKDPKIRAGKLKGENDVVAAAVKRGWLSYEEGEAPGAYEKVKEMIRAEERGGTANADDLVANAEAKARAEEADAINDLAKKYGIDTRDMTKQQKLDAIEKAEEKVLEAQGIKEANDAAVLARDDELDARTLDEIVREVGVTDKDIEDAKYAKERELEGAAAADEARRARVGDDENPQGGDGEAPRRENEKRPDPRPGGEQVDSGSGSGDGSAGEKGPAAGEAGGEPAAKSRPDEAAYRVNALPFDAAFRAVKDMMGDGKQWRAWVDHLGELTAGLAKQLKKPGEALANLKKATTTASGENAAVAVIRFLNEDLGRRARIIVDKTDSPTARKVLDMMDFELGKGEGTGKVFREDAQQRMGKSLNELAPELEIVNGIAETMRKGGMSRHDAYAKAWEEVIKRVENPNLARQGDIGKAADKVEAWLKAQRDMQVKAGVDIGDQGKQYFPVKYDADKVQADRVGFEKAATAAYMREDGTLVRPDAEAMAKALADGLIRGESFSLVGIESGAAASATKERVFTKTASLNALRQYRNLDGRDVLISYANSAARRAAIAERFGDNFGGTKDKQGKTIVPSWKELTAKISEEGGNGALPILRQMVEVGTGVNQPRGQGANYADAMRNAMTMSALEKSVLPNMMETVTPLATTNGNVAAGLSMLRTNIHGALGGLGLLPKSERRAAAQALLEGIGALSDIGSQQQAMARYSGSDSSKGGFGAAVGKFFEGIGLNKLTDAQRISTADIGAVWFDSLAKAVSGNSGWKSLTKGADAKHLRDMGIPADKVQDFAKYVTGLKGKIPTTAELGKAGEMGALYGDAITRFMNSTVQHGDALTRPAWASSPWGSLVFQFSSYTYAFHKNVVRRAYNNALDAGNLKNNLTTADRLSLASGMLPGFMLMGAVSYLTMELRDEVFNDLAGTKKNLSDQAKKERAVQNANLFGKYGRVFEQFGQQRYGAGAAGLFVPPAVAQGAKGVDALSQAYREGTEKNTGERKMVKWTYNTILEPAWQIGLSAGPGIPFGAASVAARTLVPSAGEKVFVDEVAGPAKKRSEKPQKGVFE